MATITIPVITTTLISQITNLVNITIRETITKTLSGPTITETATSTASEGVTPIQEARDILIAVLSTLTVAGTGIIAQYVRAKNLKRRLDGRVNITEQPRLPLGNNFLTPSIPIPQKTGTDIDVTPEELAVILRVQEESRQRILREPPAYMT